MKRGIPSATICSTGFVPVARKVAQSLGVPHLPIIEVHEQVGFDSPVALEEVARGVSDAVPEILRRYQAQTVKGRRLEDQDRRDSMDIDPGNDLSSRVSELFLQENWTDGLPVVPPTEDRVRAMLATVAAAPHEVLGIQIGRASCRERV